MSSMERADPANNIYLVEKLMDRRWHGNRVEYLVKWLNYGHDQNTWEPRTNINAVLCDAYDCAAGGPLEGPTRNRRTSKKPTTPTVSPKKRVSTPRAPPKKRENVETPPKRRRLNRKTPPDYDSVTASSEPTETAELNQEPSTSAHDKPSEEPTEQSVDNSDVADPNEEEAAKEPSETPQKEESNDSAETDDAEDKGPSDESPTEDESNANEQQGNEDEQQPESVADDDLTPAAEEPAVVDRGDDDESKKGVYTFIVSNQRNPVDSKLMHVYENAPQSEPTNDVAENPTDAANPASDAIADEQAQDVRQESSPSTAVNPSTPAPEKGPEGSALPENSVHTEVTVNNSTSTIVEI